MSSLDKLEDAERNVDKVDADSEKEVADVKEKEDAEARKVQEEKRQKELEEARIAAELLEKEAAEATNAEEERRQKELEEARIVTELQEQEAAEATNAEEEQRQNKLEEARIAAELQEQEQKQEQQGRLDADATIREDDEKKRQVGDDKIKKRGRGCRWKVEKKNETNSKQGDSNESEGFFTPVGTRMRRAMKQ